MVQNMSSAKLCTITCGPRYKYTIEQDGKKWRIPVFASLCCTSSWFEYLQNAQNL